MQEEEVGSPGSSRRGTESAGGASSLDDPDLRFAKEMAMAIQQNPNLTPQELKDLLAAKQPPARSGGSVPQRNQSSSGSKPKPLLKSITKGGKNIYKKAFTSPERKSSAIPETGGNDEDREVGQTPKQPATPLEALPSLPETGDHRIRITGIIWKRRSGLGKYSTTSAWERRRVLLRGTKLYYYRTSIDQKDDEYSGNESEGENEAFETAGVERVTSSGSSKPHWLFEQMAGVAGTKSSKKDARGYLDLVKENASVGASFGHSGAPTPFALSIKVLSQTKWKLCFDNRLELMQWLAALTDVIVQGSVDSYNSQILDANNPNAGELSSYYAGQGQLSEPPLSRSSNQRVGGHRLWEAGPYKVQSENHPEDELGNVSEDELEEIGSDDEDEPEDQPATSRDLVLELDGTKKVWGIDEDRLWRFAVLGNLALCAARSSLVAAELFWYLLLVANIGLFGLLQKQTVGGAVLNTNHLSRKALRRLSTGMGITVASSDIALPRKSSASVKATAAAEAADDALVVSATKPKAGTTAMRIENPTDLPCNKDGHVFAGWRYADPASMQIRSRNYKKDKIKVPSPGELYKVANVDIFESRKRFPDMASRVQLPPTSFDDGGKPKTWNAPDVFVISIAIPTDPPKLYSNTEDGGGYTITIYLVMHEETREILRRVTADGYDPSKDKEAGDPNLSKINAVRLLDEWCRRAPNDDAFCARFKVLPNAQNLKEIGLPTWISKYNGKPFLIKRPGQTGFLYRHPDKSCVEFDISLHPFPYLAKQGICFMKDTYFKKVLVTFGFLIEGRAEDELPECLIGLMQLCYPDPVHAIQGEDLMAGTSARSFE